MVKKEYSDEDQFQSLFVAAYLASCLECLSPDLKLKLAHIGEQFAPDGNWKAVVEADFLISRDFVHQMFKLLVQIMPPHMALQFIMRGFNCVAIDENLALTFGSADDLLDRTSRFQ